MGAEVFKIKPFKAIRTEFENFPHDINKAYGNLPGKARFKGLRDFSVGLLNKIAPIAFISSAIEIFRGPFDFNEIVHNFSYDPSVGTPMLTGTLTTKNTILHVSYFTAVTLLTGLAAATLSKFFAVHPQNEQSRTLNTIRHLWGQLSKTIQKKSLNQFDENSLKQAFHYVSALESLQKSHPREFAMSLQPISTCKLDTNKFAKLKGLISLQLYNLTAKESYLHISLENFSDGGGLDGKGEMRDWFKEKLNREINEKIINL